MDSSRAPLPPTLLNIEIAYNQLKHKVRKTPVWQWNNTGKNMLLGSDTEVWVKLESLQHTGSFKVRGVLNVLQHLTPDQLEKGVCTISAGNHAMAVSFASQSLGLEVKIAMPKTANVYAVKRCREMGAEVIIEENVILAFEKAHQIEREEKKYFIHPFEGPMITLGTATLGWEFYHQVNRLDAVIIPIGGGGLASGMSCAIKQLNPDCKVYGVEPTGANTMYLSFQTGAPERINQVNSIAASLAPPYTLPYAFAMCKQFVDEVVMIEDLEMCKAMSRLFYDMKLVVEPAGASSLAALLGPLKHTLMGKKVGIIACGANIDAASFSDYLLKGASS